MGTSELLQARSMIEVGMKDLRVAHRESVAAHLDGQEPEHQVLALLRKTVVGLKKAAPLVGTRLAKIRTQTTAGKSTPVLATAPQIGEGLLATDILGSADFSNSNSASNLGRRE
jgi:hypothetical protein